MAKLTMMPDMKWKVHVSDAKDSWWYHYTFKTDSKTKAKTVSWKDLANNMTGGGNWKFVGDKFQVTWWSGTIENWGPPDTDSWHGITRMSGKQYSLDAVALDYAELPGPVFLSDDAFISACRDAFTVVTRADYNMRVFIAATTIPYATAYKNHLAALKDISATQELAQNMLLQCALAFVGGGIGGLVGGVLKKAQTDDFTVDALKDLAKYGAKGPLAAVLKQRPATTIPDDPLIIKSEMEVDLAKELLWVHDMIEEWKTFVEQNIAFDRDFHPVTVVQNSLKITTSGGVVNMLNTPPAIPQDVLRKCFERGWIEAWVKQYGDTVTWIPGGREAVRAKLNKYGQSVGANMSELLEKYVPLPDHSHSKL